MKYKTTENKKVKWLLVLGMFLLGVIIYIADRRSGLPIIIVLPFTMLVIMEWVVSSTYYEIQDNVLIISSSGIKRKIAISDITIIEKSKAYTAGVNMGYGQSGYKIHYKTGRFIFVSPEREEDFLQFLVKANPGIRVV